MTAPTDARAHVWQGRPGCVACGGLGTIHQQVPGELRVVRVRCACTHIDLQPAGAWIEIRAEDLDVAKAQEKRA